MYKMKSKIVILIFALVSIFVIFNEDKEDHNQFNSDVCGYYLYLPAFFIYHDAGKFDFYPGINNKYSCSFALNAPLPGMDGKRLDKYPLGVAFFEMPLFLAAHCYCMLSGQYPADGFTPPYQVAIMLSNIFWVVLGLIVLRRFLKKYFDDTIVSVTLFCLTFGTNLYAYSGFQPGMSHGYSFFLFACLLSVTTKFYDEPWKLSSSVLLGLCMGFIFIGRPINVIAIIIPVFWKINNLQTAKNRALFFIAHYKITLAFIMSFFFVAAVQFSYWHYITGYWFVWSYPGEGFNFLHPNVINGLFSYRKGWFVYTPMALVAMSGFYFLRKKDKTLFPALAVFFIVMGYVVFSWRQWWYGGSFGCRVMVESYTFLALPMGALVEHFYVVKNKFIKAAAFCAIILMSGLNIFQTYQYSMGLIHWSRMTREYYWKVFGKIDFDRGQNEKYLIPEDQEGLYNN